MNQRQFNTLKNEWYQKLRETGFEDIEREVGGLQVFHGRKNRLSEILNIPYEVRLAKEQYFRVLSQILSDEKTEFYSENHRKIMELHLEGKTQVAISKEVGFCVRHIRRIIKSYVIAWGIVQ